MRLHDVSVSKISGGGLIPQTAVRQKAIPPGPCSTTCGHASRRMHPGRWDLPASRPCYHHIHLQACNASSGKFANLYIGTGSLFTVESAMGVSMLRDGRWGAASTKNPRRLCV